MLFVEPLPGAIKPIVAKPPVEKLFTTSGMHVSVNVNVIGEPWLPTVCGLPSIVYAKKPPGVTPATGADVVALIRCALTKPPVPVTTFPGPI